MAEEDISKIKNFQIKHHSGIVCTIPFYQGNFQENEYDRSLMIKPESECEEISKTRTNCNQSPLFNIQQLVKFDFDNKFLKNISTNINSNTQAEQDKLTDSDLLH